MPIRWRLTIFNALAIGAILLLLGLALFFLLRDALLSDIEEAVESRAAAAAGDVEDREDAEELASGDEAEELARDGVFFVARDAKGNVLARTTEPADEPADPVWERALETGEPASGTAVLSDEAPDFVHAVPVDPPEGPPLVIEAGKSYEDAEETLAAFRAVLAVGIGAAFLLSIVGAYLLARAALRPVDAVVDSAREMGESDLSRRLPVSNPGDEIGRLATTINGLLSRLQAAFARREEALRRQRRLAADASHELRTPLTSISGHARMLDEWALEDPRTARKSARAIRKESDRMRDLVDALLALTRGDEGAPLDVGRHDLAQIAAEAVEAARGAADGKVSVAYAPPEGKVEATFDRERIRRAAAILLDNAVKYTPEGGSVEAEVRGEDDRAVLEVSDTGIGIPEDQLPLVFERFHRADSSRAAGGAGLGLSIARQIAEAHGGTLEARSTLGKGSSFALYLPRRTPVEPNRGAPHGPETPHAHR